jgi:predicted transcriptional regulator
MAQQAIRVQGMSNLQSFTIELDSELAANLVEAAKKHGFSPESMAAECVAQHLEIALRHRVLVERMEAIDHNLAVLAVFVGEATQGGEGLDLTGICRYGRGDRKAK